MPQNSPDFVTGCQPGPVAGNQPKVAPDDLLHPAITLLQRIDSEEASE
ncbi:hypothetical protein ACLHDD_06525 [Pantoea sp. NSTU24]